MINNKMSTIWASKQQTGCRNKCKNEPINTNPNQVEHQVNEPVVGKIIGSSRITCNSPVCIAPKELKPNGGKQ